MTPRWERGRSQRKMIDTTAEKITEHHPAPREGHEAEYELLEEMIGDLKDAIIEEDTYVHKQPRRIFVQVHPEKIRNVIQHMLDKYDMWQFITVSGRDLGDDLQACYHFVMNDRKIAITFRLNVPRNKPEHPTISDLVPAAEFIENEVRELFGIVQIGHPNVRRIELPEDWPANEYPMRKDWEDPRGLMKKSRTTGPKEGI
ncbi:MAG: NADH-quinone oxidoreductase subunit C [Candidatus Thorarchaeota archaeon]|nr:MAG: NADH-quinone oxidoreductase subunit C [Candidatus Thorarchaeota archaeon]